jgi:NAD(P)-dependent dehydrogenase (short-subunit alcohol dehydrogenase family)
MILKGEHLFVTGGAAGIGEAIVLGGVKEGAKISFVDIDDAKANALVEKLTSEGHQHRLDLTKMCRLVFRFGEACSSWCKDLKMTLHTNR